MLDKDKIKNSLTKYDIIKILEYLGSPLQKEEGADLIFQTICHNDNGEGSSKLYYYSDNKVFYCYTSCGGMDIYGLVMKSRRGRGEIVTFPQAVNLVANLTGKRFTEDSGQSLGEHIIDDWSFLNRYSRIKEKKREETTLEEIDSHFLSYFTPLPHMSWIEEGISWDAQKRFEIGYDWRSDKIVIPHRDKAGRLVGIRGRALKQSDLDEGRKYMPMYLDGNDFSHSLGANLYGLCQNKEAIASTKKMVVFEGEKSVIKCDDYFGREGNFSTAVCGNSLTPFQKDLIMNSGVDELYIAFDKEYDDPKGEEATQYFNYLEKLVQNFTPYMRVFILWDFQEKLERQDSPADRGREILLELIGESVEIVTKRINKEEEL